MDEIEKILEYERLHFAVQDGNRELVNKLLDEGCSPNSFDEISKTPLHYAVGK